MPDFPIVIKATDQFSAAMKTMRDSTQRFTKDMEGMQSRLEEAENSLPRREKERRSFPDGIFPIYAVK